MEWPSYIDEYGVSYSKNKLTLEHFPQDFDGEYKILDGVTQIGPEAFKYCKIKSLTIPSSVAKISERNFSSCWCLESINVDEANPYFCSIDGVLLNKERTKIISYPRSRSAKSYLIPETISKIGELAFYDCWRLDAIEVAKSNLYFSSINGVLFNKEQTEIIFYPAGKKDSTYSIPNTVFDIGNWAFGGCGNLITVEIHNRLQRIGNWAFYGCRSLKHIEIPDSVQYLGWETFWLCKSLESVKIGKGISKLESNTFSNCECLTSVQIPGNVTKIKSWAFSNCKSLEKVSISNGVSSLESSVFADCTNLTAIDFPHSILSLEKDILKGCESIKYIYVPFGDEDRFAEMDGLKDLKRYISGKSSRKKTLRDFVKDLFSLIKEYTN